MAAANIKRISFDEAQARRAELLQHLDGAPGIRARAATHNPDPGEQGLLDELEDLEFLVSLQPQSSTTSTSPLPPHRPAKRRTTPPMNNWIVTYDDGEEIRTVTVRGKLSLDSTWAFIMDTQRSPSTIILAVPARRVIDVKEAPSPEGS